MLASNDNQGVCVRHPGPSFFYRVDNTHCTVSGIYKRGYPIFVFCLFTPVNSSTYPLTQ